MEIGIGLPNVVKGTRGVDLLAWAHNAEASGFSSLSALDRLAYPVFEPLAVLGAVAAVTKRVRLIANVLLAPTRDPFVLAKQAATVHQISDRRLVLGLGVGRRRDDYEVVGKSFRDRGKRFDVMLEQLNDLWMGAGNDSIVPEPLDPQRVPILVGGQSDATPRRVAKWGIGWTSGGARSLEDVAEFAGKVREAWDAEVRTGTPRILALCYFSVGHRERSRAQTVDYYGFLGPKVRQLAAATPHNAQAILAFRDRCVQAGIDELTFMPTINDPDQVEKLAAIVFG